MCGGRGGREGGKEGVGWGWEWVFGEWWWWCRHDNNDEMFVHNAACVHRIGDRTPESQTPGVPVTWASTSRWTEAEKSCISAAKTEPARHPKSS